ncbi:hypothetical protein FIV34_03075 [Luteibacter pinisoli]|uniref:Uncharacterized protein n=1 Tax=Luteibacter pinisoli TaxID=2589080 RepID=A0A4Y5Z0Q3_9GAMM|nr:hypothetical protein [Luteibacter pinisoli]QDE38255.1 hypothetical protein FIV34_03075 [Luteibacter pinisoli]
MRTVIRSAVAFASFAVVLASGSAMAVTASSARVGHAATIDLKALLVPVKCKNPAECSVKNP